MPTKRTLKSIRVDLDLTQEEMAKKLGVSLLSWRNKETYRTPLLATELIKVMTLSGVAATDIKIV